MTMHNSIDGAASFVEGEALGRLRGRGRQFKFQTRWSRAAAKSTLPPATSYQ
jgi:hypothetical protein